MPTRNWSDFLKCSRIDHISDWAEPPHSVPALPIRSFLRFRDVIDLDAESTNVRSIGAQIARPSLDHRLRAAQRVRILFASTELEAAHPIAFRAMPALPAGR